MKAIALNAFVHNDRNNSEMRKLSSIKDFLDLEVLKKTGHGTAKIISIYGNDVFDIYDGFVEVIIHLTCGF